METKSNLQKFEELLEKVNEPRKRKRKSRPLIKSSKHRRIEGSEAENDKKAESSLEKREKLAGSSESKQSKWKYFIFIVLIGISTLILSQIEWSQCGLFATYKNNFNKIVHGDEQYCYRELNPSTIVKELENNLVNQKDAIKLIEVSLKLGNRENFISMSFGGPVGVGKTLSSNIIAKNFKWQENVNQLIYEMNFDQSLKVNESLENDVEVVSSRFSECGFNLVIIDDVEVKNTSIERISLLEQKLHEMTKQKLLKIVLIVIFRGEVSQDQLEHFVIIDFQPFTKESFHECIERHQKLYQVNLKPAEVLSLQMLNFTVFGCKTVAKKINLISKV